MNEALRERLEAEREEARELFAKMEPRLVLRRLRESPPADAPESDGHAGSLRERVEAERAEARELLARMQPREMASRLAAPGPSPLVVVGVCFLVGILLAKLLDWRGHAHPA